MGFGVLLFLRVIGVILDALGIQAPAERTTLALNAANFIITPAWVMGGILLWRRQALGYVAGLALLFQASMLFIGLMIFMILQPFLTSAPFVGSDVIAVFIMGLVCFVPFALFVRGVATKGRPTGNGRPRRSVSPREGG